MIFQQINQLFKRIYLLTKRNRRENSVNALMLFKIYDSVIDYKIYNFLFFLFLLKRVILSY